MKYGTLTSAYYPARQLGSLRALLSAPPWPRVLRSIEPSTGNDYRVAECLDGTRGVVECCGKWQPSRVMRQEAPLQLRISVNEARIDRAVIASAVLR